ncbi:hypothetical protein DITRI_Ditri17bG0106700 [Diplodiscus trichospermus]
MGNGKTSRRGLKICCGVTAIFILIIAIVLTTLALTVFKPKNPEITVYPQGLENIAFGRLGGFSNNFLSNATANVTVGMVVAISNPNYGSFKFKNTTAFVNYRGDVVAEVPIQQSLVPAHGKLNISTSADFMVDRLVSNTSFWADVFAGSVNFTTGATVHGMVTMLKVLKLHASVPSSCVISIFVLSQSVESSCKSKIVL